jgi:hypothetical protein
MPPTVQGYRGKDDRLVPALRRRSAPSRLAALTLLPGALTIYAAFNAGGFFVGTTALLAVCLAVAAALRILLAEEPFGGLGPAVGVAAGALALYCAWVLVSVAWSDSAGRAVVEFDRALLYLLTLLLFGSIHRSARGIRTMIWGLATASFVVSLAGLLTRLLPKVFPTGPTIQSQRLGFPLTYLAVAGAA